MRSGLCAEGLECLPYKLIALFVTLYSATNHASQRAQLCVRARVCACACVCVREFVRMTEKESTAAGCAEGRGGGEAHRSLFSKIAKKMEEDNGSPVVLGMAVSPNSDFSPSRFSNNF